MAAIVNFSWKINYIFLLPSFVRVFIHNSECGISISVASQPNCYGKRVFGWRGMFSFTAGGGENFSLPREQRRFVVAVLIFPVNSRKRLCEILAPKRRIIAKMGWESCVSIGL